MPVLDADWYSSKKAREETREETAACTLDGDWKLRREGGMRGECLELENDESLAVRWGGLVVSGGGIFSPSNKGWKKVGME